MGREKMFFQDPQYVPWSLMDQKEIDKMGDKLNISKDTPNRNAVIQDTARKTAVQGNTLWMYTAGLATPMMSALACNKLEPKIDGAIRNANLRNTQKHLEQSSLTFIQRIKRNLDIKKAHKFIEGMQGKALDASAIEKIAKRLGNDDVAVSRTLAEELTQLAQTKKAASIPFTQDILDRILESAKHSGSQITLDQIAEASGVREVSEATIDTLAGTIAKLANPGNAFKQKQAKGAIAKAMSGVFEAERMPKVGVISETLGKLADAMGNLKAQSGIIDRFLAARTKKMPGTLLGTQYGAFNQSVIEALGIRPSTKLLSDDEIIGRIEKFVSSDRFDRTVRSLGDRIETFHRDFSTTTVFDKIDSTLEGASRQLRDGGLGSVADKLTGKKVSLTRTLEVLGLKDIPVTRERLVHAISQIQSEGQKQALAEAVRQDTSISAFGDMDKLKRVIDTAFEGQQGTMRRSLRTEIEQRILGAESSFYRTIQTFDVFSRIKNGHLASQLRDCGLQDSEIPDAIEYAKKFITKGTIVDQSDKAKYMGTLSGKKIHDAVMRVLFDDEAFPTEIGSDLLKARLRVYKKEVKSKIVDILHRMEAPTNEGWLAGTLDHMQGITKHNLIGEPVVEAVRNGAQNMKNSNKWLKIFGSAFLVLAGITLIAGTQFGKPKKTQKANEGEKTNG